MTVANGDIFEVAARMEWNGSEDILNIFQFQVSNVTDSDDLAIIDDLLDIMENVYDGLIVAQPTSLAYADISFRNVTQDTVFGAFPWDSLTTGSSTDATMPSGVAGLINFATGISKVILKKYFGVFVNDTVESDGTWTNALITILTAVVNYLLGTISGTAADYDYGYLSPKTSSFVIPVSGTVPEVPAYQRRRKAGRGS